MASFGNRDYVEIIEELVMRQSVDEAHWVDTRQALNSMKKGKTLPEKAVKSWLESWGKQNEKSPPKV